MMHVNKDQYVVVAVAGVLLLSMGAGAATIETTSARSAGGDASGGSGAGGDDEDFNLSDSDSVLPVVGGNFDDLLNGSDDGAEEGHDVSEQSEGEDDGSTVPTPSVPPLLLALGVLGVLGVLAVLVRRVRSVNARDESRPTTEAVDGERDEAALAAVGASAGAGAQRLASESYAENVVYETWLEMARSLDVDDPAASTPGEFATAAVDAGMSPPDVARLTAVFEDIRYGDEDVTAERERTAREAFRRIEREYDDVEDAANAADADDVADADVADVDGDGSRERGGSS